MRKGLVLTWLVFLLAGVALLFWRSEWIYSLPTPVPANYHDVRLGSTIDLPQRALLQPEAASGQSQTAALTLSLAVGAPVIRSKPLFLHFFNPDCPCSRFNMPHFRSLVQRYGNRVDFAIVLMTDKKFTADQIRERLKLPYPIPVLTDSSVAAACGVYSTPQAVILDTRDRLYYRGNYNRTRYCTDEKSSYARMALDGLLQNNYTQTFPSMALKAYGCQLPTCNR
ncbi:MAG TPA: hypothetical protein VGM30_16890 [Puia sp.]|jgi:hypothetical protein